MSGLPLLMGLAMCRWRCEQEMELCAPPQQCIMGHVSKTGGFCCVCLSQSRWDTRNSSCPFTQKVQNSLVHFKQAALTLLSAGEADRHSNYRRPDPHCAPTLNFCTTHTLLH